MRIRILLVALAAVASLPAQRKVSDEEVARVHKAAFLIDTHNDVTSKTVTGFDIGPRAPSGHTDIVRMKEGGMGGQFFAVYVAANYVEGNRAANRTLQMIDTVRHDIIGKYPATFQYATSVKEILAARQNGKIAALMGIEGGHAIEDSLRLLRDYYLLGVRYMTLTHSNTNNWADSSGDVTRENVKHHNGLTEFGKDVVREMNRLGMMVDIAHVADKTFYDALEVSKAPIFSSHSSCRALCDVPRNMTDEMIQALAKKGGVIQINFSCGFLSQAAADASGAGRRGGRGANPAFQARVEKETEGKNLTPEQRQDVIRKIRDEMGIREVRATLADVVAHIDHVKKIAGIDHVGIGGDFDGVGCTPDGLDDVSKYPNLTRALLEKGYTAAEITKIYSGNVLRVMRAVEVAAGK
ncbi:MAG TPA: dipeptidase [Bryobacteraceae bacterium]|nr:dipeptidase [Bryobacteraceae bacterium]